MTSSFAVQAQKKQPAVKCEEVNMQKLVRSSTSCFGDLQVAAASAKE